MKRSKALFALILFAGCSQTQVQAYDTKALINSINHVMEGRVPESKIEQTGSGWIIDLQCRRHKVRLTDMATYEAVFIEIDGPLPSDTFQVSDDGIDGSVDWFQTRDTTWARSDHLSERVSLYQKHLENAVTFFQDCVKMHMR